MKKIFTFLIVNAGQLIDVNLVKKSQFIFISAAAITLLMALAIKLIERADFFFRSSFESNRKQRIFFLFNKLFSDSIYSFFNRYKAL